MHACHCRCTQDARRTSSVHGYATMPPTDLLRWTSMILWSELSCCALVDHTCRQSDFSGVQRASMEHGHGSPVFASALEAAILHMYGLSPRICGQDIHFLALCTDSRRRCLSMTTRGKSVSQQAAIRASEACGTGARMNQLWQRMALRSYPPLSSVCNNFTKNKRFSQFFP